MIVLFSWTGAVVVALILLAVVGLELRGHAQRLSATLGDARRDLLPRVERLTTGLRTAGQSGHSTGITARDDLESTPGGSGRHRADP